MPEQAITINRDQRDGLYALVRNHLGAVGDFWLVFEQDRDFAKAERLGARIRRRLPAAPGHRLERSRPPRALRADDARP